MTQLDRVTLGRVYEDQVTGFVGTATTRMTAKNGCVSVGLVPRVGANGKLRRAVAFFETQLLDSATRDSFKSVPDPKVLALLGHTYRDVKTAFTGTAGEHVEMLNGAAQLTLRGPLLPDGKMGERWSIDLSDLVDVATETRLKHDKPIGPADSQVH